MAIILLLTQTIAMRDHIQCDGSLLAHHAIIYAASLSPTQTAGAAMSHKLYSPPRKLHPPKLRRHRHRRTANERGLIPQLGPGGKCPTRLEGAPTPIKSFVGLCRGRSIQQSAPARRRYHVGVASHNAVDACRISAYPARRRNAPVGSDQAVTALTEHSTIDLTAAASRFVIAGRHLVAGYRLRWKRRELHQ